MRSETRFPDFKRECERLAEGELDRWDEFEQGLLARRFRKGEQLFHPGESTATAYWIARGVVKLGYDRSDGRVFTKALLGAGTFFASVDGDPHTAPEFGAVCLTEVMILRTPLARIAHFAQSSPSWARLLDNRKNEHIASKHEREREMLMRSAEERWLELLRSRPELVSQVSQGELAGLIGVTPVALSRLKKRLAFGGVQRTDRDKDVPQ